MMMLCFVHYHLIICFFLFCVKQCFFHMFNYAIDRFGEKNDKTISCRF